MPGTTSSNLVSLKNGTYDKLKFVVQILLPALGTLYFSVGALWGFPNVEQVIGTITAVSLFGGALLGLSKRSYDRTDAQYDGALVVDTSDPDKDRYNLEVDIPIPEIKHRGSILLKVSKPSSPDVTSSQE